MFNNLSRRQFIRSALLGTTAAPFVLNAVPRAFAAVGDPVLVHCMLFGGADLRHVFAPSPGTPQAPYYWTAREVLFQWRWNNGIPLNYSDPSTFVPADYSAVNPTPADAYADMFNDHYVQIPGQDFGIHKSCGWLIQQFQPPSDPLNKVTNVAIVANADGSNNRRHDHSQLIMLTGDKEVGINDYDRNGWGGRLMEHINDNGGLPGGAEANAVSMTSVVPIFCYGDNAVNRLEHVVHTPNTQQFGFNQGGGTGADSTVMSRAIEAYYGVKGAEVAADPTKQTGWPFSLFYQHEASIRGLQTQFNDIVQPGVIDHPVEISDLYSVYRPNSLNGTEKGLYRTSFGRQIANLFDCMYATDLLGMKVAHLDYGGWDSHDNQQYYMQRNLHDIFGIGGGFDMLRRSLATDNPGAEGDLIMVFSSDFGRQIMGNGTAGTDHGNGSYMIMIGDDLAHGVYGDMFPDDEIPLYDVPRSGITGKTSVEEVFKVLCDWTYPGSGAAVFPGLDGTDIETGVNLNFL
ncbi:DUF1501 domain-containing protein [bacterium]|nr:DUF1501 domain-containing protein [bacterium]